MPHEDCSCTYMKETGDNEEEDNLDNSSDHGALVPWLASAPAQLY